jgi:hypothetical protein
MIDIGEKYAVSSCNMLEISVKQLLSYIVYAFLSPQLLCHKIKYDFVVFYFGNNMISVTAVHSYETV